MSDPGIKILLDLFTPVSLEDMDNVRLMNRIDTKYVLSKKMLPDILNRIDGKYKVLEINEKRVFSYSTTYLDTKEYLFFDQHVTGKLERNKVRYRKYDTTDKVYLEVKKKTNKNRTIKWRIENSLTSGNLYDDKAISFINEYIPQKSLSLKPVLMNNFKRVTLVGSEINERITIDYDLSFSDSEGDLAGFPFVAIIELKRQGFSERSPMVTILKELSIRPTGFSKYCMGVAALYEVPRKNILKRKFLLLNNIENEFNRYDNA
ncbi:MAG TPA: polyphosphate polymerase domain-containing protein [Bacteroidales bacterium]|nr:polyphosphate polymerase domain-containing protein [Bacteroidales bacterium]